MIVGVIIVLRVIGQRVEEDDYDDAPPA